MSPSMTNTLLSFVPENNQLFAATLLCGSCQHRSILQNGSAYHCVVGIRDQQYLIKTNLLTDFNRKSIDLKRLADGNLVLSSTTFNYCKHDFCHSPFPSRAESDSKGYVEGMGGEPYALFRFPEKTHSYFSKKLRRKVYTWLEQSNAHLR